jgi:hypothetical protein
MAANAAFAEHVRAHPDDVAAEYGLSTDEIEKVLALADAESPAGPAPLGPRLSRSGIGAGGMLSLLSSLGDAADQAVTPMKMVPPKAGLPTFEPTEATDAPAKPHMAVPAATEPPVEESTSTDQASLKTVPIKMVPPAASLFQPNVDPGDDLPSDDDLTGPSVEAALAGPEPHLSTTIAVELPGTDLSGYSPAGGGSEDPNPTEEISFNYEKIEYEHLEMDEKKDVRPTTPNWDIDEAKDS